MYLFADDTKLIEMDYWSKICLIKFNLEKCHILTFGKPNPFKNTFRLGNQIIQRVKMEKDLGVSVDSNLSFENHIAIKIYKQTSWVDT